MIVADIVFALLVALVFSFAFYGFFKRPGPWGSMWAFVLATFLAVLAIGAWAEPLGPAVYDVHIVPFVFAGLLIMLLFAAIPAASTPVKRTPRIEAETTEPERTGVAIGLAFWVFVVFLVFASSAAYVAALSEFV